MTPHQMIPVLIPTAGGALAGYFHPAQGRPRAALVVCNPFGYEAVCAHRSIRELAEKAAQNGVSTLRFDFVSTGNSIDASDVDDLIERWQGDVRGAIDWLHLHVPDTQVFIGGVRLGATLAHLAAVSDPRIYGAILIAPILSGRRYLRELKALQSAFGANVHDFSAEDSDLQFLGFAMNAATRDSLAMIDLAAKDGAAAPNLLIFERPGFATPDSWVDRLRTNGSDVSRVVTDEFAAMMLDPHETKVPNSLIRDLVDWILASVPVTTTATPNPAVDASEPETNPAARIVSHERGTFGMLTTPALSNGRKPAAAFIFLNAGATHNIGPNRLYVEWSRRLSKRGFVALRTDLSGIGESPARAPDPTNTVYSFNALQDVAEAIRFVREEYGSIDIHLVGLCSGAYHAFLAARSGTEIAGLVMINPLTFFWDYDSHTPIGNLSLAKRAIAARGDGRREHAVIRLLKNPMKVGRAADFVARRVSQLSLRQLRIAGRYLRIPTRADLGGELRRLTRKNIRVQFIFSEDDPGRDLLRMQGEPFTSKLINAGKIKLDIVHGADHTFTLLRHQESLTRALDRYVESIGALNLNAQTAPHAR